MEIKGSVLGGGVMKRYLIPILIISAFVLVFMLGCSSVPPSVVVPAQESILLVESTPVEYEQQISDLEQQVSSLTKRVSNLEEIIGSLESKVKMYSIIVMELESSLDQHISQTGEQ